jgi:hypothetical protein
MMRHIAGALMMILPSLIGTAQASDEGVLKAIPGKTVCQAQDIHLGSKVVQGQLCTLEGNFGHDKYIFDVAGEHVLAGIDDETTKGIAGSYNGDRINMTCKPEETKPAADDPMVASMAKSLMSKAKPGTSEQEAHAMAMAMLTTEIGRRCTIDYKGQSVMNVSVHFD